MIDVAPPALSLSARFMKRTVDVAVASAGLIALVTGLLVSAIAIKMSSPGPVLFRQLRVGRGGRPFTIYKLRTMHMNAEEIRHELVEANGSDGLFKIKEDPRIHRFGRFLRRTSLDEIPQLFNVLRGDMALVGPRPFVLEESERIDGWAARRFEVRPGLTGLWQVSGRSNLNFDELQAPGLPVRGVVVAQVGPADHVAHARVRSSEPRSVLTRPVAAPADRSLRTVTGACAQ